MSLLVVVGRWCLRAMRGRRVDLGVVLVCCVLCSLPGCKPKTLSDELDELKERDSSIEYPITDFPVGIYKVRPSHAMRAMSQMSAAGTVILPEKMPEMPLEDVPVSGYVGAESCRECHEEIYESTLQTAHWNSSRPATLDTVMGPFDPPANELRTSVKDFTFTMLNEDGALWQKVTLKYGPRFTHKESIDIVVGSGKSGQSYLYWSDKALYQLPVSYMTEVDRWVNSPGYAEGTAAFCRPVTARCVECHMTSAYGYYNFLNLFEPETLNFGITCEKCHGPGKTHIAHHGDAQARTDRDPIYNPADDVRGRAGETCRLCHSGEGHALTSPLSYRPGRRLDSHYQFNESDTAGGIHTANQFQRLSLSKCFTGSEQMGCTKCHDPHRHERGDLAGFARKCMSCHQVTECRPAVERGAEGASSCVKCHMPLHDDEAITSEVDGMQFTPKMRDHFIRIVESAK